MKREALGYTSSSLTTHDIPQTVNIPLQMEQHGIHVLMPSVAVIKHRTQSSLGKKNVSQYRAPG